LGIDNYFFAFAVCQFDQALVSSWKKAFAVIGEQDDVGVFDMLASLPRSSSATTLCKASVIRGQRVPTDGFLQQPLFLPLWAFVYLQ